MERVYEVRLLPLYPSGGRLNASAEKADGRVCRGNGTNCVRIVPYSAVQFSSYTVYKKVWVSSRFCKPR